MHDTRIIDQPCWSKSTGQALGHIVDTGYGVHGFRILVITVNGDLVDCSNTDVCLTNPKDRPAPERPQLAPRPTSHTPPGTGTGNPGSKPPTFG